MRQRTLGMQQPLNAHPAMEGLHQKRHQSHLHRAPALMAPVVEVRHIQAHVAFVQANKETKNVHGFC